MRRVAAEAVVDGTCVEERIDIEILRARTDVQIASVRWQVRLGFVGPDGVKAFAQNIFFNGVPVPVRGVRVRRIEIGTGLVVWQAVRQGKSARCSNQSYCRRKS